MLDAFGNEQTQVVLVHASSIQLHSVGFSSDILSGLTSTLMLTVFVLAMTVYILQLYLTKTDLSSAHVCQGVCRMFAASIGQGTLKRRVHHHFVAFQLVLEKVILNKSSQPLHRAGIGGPKSNYAKE